MPKKKITDVRPGERVVDQHGRYLQVTTIVHSLDRGEVLTQVSAASVVILPDEDGLIEVLPSAPPTVAVSWDAEGQQWVVHIGTPGAANDVRLLVMLNDGADLFWGAPAAGDDREEAFR